MADFKNTTSGTALEVSLHSYAYGGSLRLMNQLILSLVLIILTGPSFAREASVCSPNFSSEKVFGKQSYETRLALKETLRSSCDSKLSDSQIAGRVLKSCFKNCDTDSLKGKNLEDISENSSNQCRSQCLATLQRLAKENRRLKTAKR